MPITEKQIQRFIKTPDHCPYCNSEAIDFYELEMTEETYRQESACRSCERHWFNILSITGIEEKEETEDDVIIQLQALLNAFIANASNTSVIQTVLMPTVDHMIESIDDYLRSTKLTNDIQVRNTKFLSLLREFKTKMEQFE